MLDGERGSKKGIGDSYSEALYPSPDKKRGEDEVVFGEAPEKKNFLARSMADEDKKEERTLGWVATYITLIKGFVCTAVLYLPRAYWNGGYIFSAVALFLSYILTLICAMKLLKVAKEVPGDFSEIGYKIYGTKGKIAADISIVASQVGFVTAYVAFISTSLSEVVSQSTDGKVNINHWYFGLLCFLIYCPLCWIRKIAVFNITHLFADIVIIMMLIGIIVYASMYKGPAAGFEPLNTSAFLEMVGFSVYSYEGIGVVLPISQICKVPEQFNNILFWTMTTVLLSYVGFGEFCYFIYGSELGKINIITELMPATWPVWALKVIFCFNLIFTYPLMLHPANIAIESYLFKGWPKSKKRQWSKNLYRAIMVAFTVVITMLMEKDLSNFLAVLGALACTPVAFLLPTFYHLKQCAESKREIYTDYVIIVISFIIMVFSTSFDIYKWVNEVHK